MIVPNEMYRNHSISREFIIKISTWFISPLNVVIQYQWKPCTQDWVLSALCKHIHIRIQSISISISMANALESIRSNKAYQLDGSFHFDYICYRKNYQMFNRNSENHNWLRENRRHSFWMNCLLWFGDV